MFHITAHNHADEKMCYAGFNGDTEEKALEEMESWMKNRGIREHCYLRFNENKGGMTFYLPH